jgi:hypothetical protein
MAIKSKVLAATGVLTLAGGLSGIGALSASAATPQCGRGCVEVYSAKYATATSLGWVETVFLGIPARGVPTEVRPASGSNPAEDLIVPTGHPVPVSTFYAEGMVSAAVNEHFGMEDAVQIEYAPYGKPTGLGTAVAVTAYQDEGKSLQPCSIPGVTVWIIDVFADAAPLPDRQRVGHRLRPPVRDDDPGEPGAPAVHADHHAAPAG